MRSRLSPFNGRIEVGLRALCVLAVAYPEGYSVQRLTALDYLLVHSEDIPGAHPVFIHLLLIAEERS